MLRLSTFCKVKLGDRGEKWFKKPSERFTGNVHVRS